MVWAVIDMSALDKNQMRDYAIQMYAEGERLHRTHRGGAGVCLSCGREWPCAGRERSEELMRHYREWVPAYGTLLIA